MLFNFNDNGKLKRISCLITHQNFKQTGFGLLKTAVCLTRQILDKWSAYAAVRVIYIYIYIFQFAKACELDNDNDVDILYMLHRSCAAICLEKPNPLMEDAKKNHCCLALVSIVLGGSPHHGQGGRLQSLQHLHPSLSNTPLRRQAISTSFLPHSNY